MPVVQVVNLAEKLTRFSEHWSPKIVGQVNDMHVKVVKLSGEFVWHHHDAEDELFLVVRGRLRMQLRDGDREVGPGEFIIVPRGVEHCPLALTDEVHVVLLEPVGTVNTGSAGGERTAEPETI
jgi:mannose-6-phosphate isomerase-like protein (cupin superfamily)